LITGNIAEYKSGGILCGYNASPSIINCTITQNTAIDSGGGIYSSNSNPKVINSILWNNYNQEIALYLSNPVISFSDIMGGWSGTGNINSDPLFVNPAYGDFRILPDSPCVDTGDPTSSVPYGGGCRIDMGAYEFYKGYNCKSDLIPSVNSKSSNLRR
jgi:predicted outer membrane repeat protein